MSKKALTACFGGRRRPKEKNEKFLQEFDVLVTGKEKIQVIVKKIPALVVRPK